MAYKDFYLDPQWQKRRLQVLERARFKCDECWDEKSTLHVHHTHYVRGKKPWEYDDTSLVCLCKSCHERETAKLDELNLLIGEIGAAGCRLDLVLRVVREIARCDNQQVKKIEDSVAGDRNGE